MASDIQSILSEFELVVGTKLSCIDSTENSQSQIVSNSVRNLLAAMIGRLELELLTNRRSDSAAPTQYGFQARKLSGNTLEDAEKNPRAALLAENAAIVSGLWIFSIHISYVNFVIIMFFFFEYIH